MSPPCLREQKSAECPVGQMLHRRLDVCLHLSVTMNVLFSVLFVSACGLNAIKFSVFSATVCCFDERSWLETVIVAECEECQVVAFVLCGFLCVFL